MGKVIRFVSKSDSERARLIREARAIYNSVFPSVELMSEEDRGSYTCVYRKPYLS
jgi:hypothetical protein